MPKPMPWPPTGMACWWPKVAPPTARKTSSRPNDWRAKPCRWIGRMCARLVFYAHRRSLLHRDYLAAQALFGRALDIQPSSAEAWRWSSFTYAYIGNASEAIRRADRALQLSPCDRDPHSFYLALCVAHYTAGDYGLLSVDWGMRAWRRSLCSRHGRMGRRCPGCTGTNWRGTLDRRRSHGRKSARSPGQRVIASHPYRDVTRREHYGRHLLAAGFPRMTQTTAKPSATAFTTASQRSM